MKRVEYDQSVEKDFLEYFNIPFPYNRPPSEWTGNDPKKIITRADPHNPYRSELVCTELLKHKDAKTLIVTGDEGDYYSKSRFRKTKHVSFKDEVRSIFFDIEWMATHWETVLIMIGNHDNRPEKQIRDLLPTDMLILTEQNLIKRICSYFDNVEVVGHQIDGAGINLTHIYQHGDIVFTHGELSRAQKTATLEYISRYLFLWRNVLKLKPYTGIVQSHNHQAMKTPNDSEWWFMLPTASDPYSLGFEYIYSSKMWGKPPAVGYSIFWQDNGETDFNKSDNVVLKWT